MNFKLTDSGQRRLQTFSLANALQANLFISESAAEALFSGGSAKDLRSVWHRRRSLWPSFIRLIDCMTHSCGLDCWPSSSGQSKAARPGRFVGQALEGIRRSVRCVAERLRLRLHPSRYQTSTVRRALHNPRRHWEALNQWIRLPRDSELQKVRADPGRRADSSVFSIRSAPVVPRISARVSLVYLLPSDSGHSKLRSQRECR